MSSDLSNTKVRFVLSICEKRAVMLRKANLDEEQ